MTLVLPIVDQPVKSPVPNDPLVMLPEVSVKLVTSRAELY